jgi:hypothetical protein
MGIHSVDVDLHILFSGYPYGLVADGCRLRPHAPQKIKNKINDVQIFYIVEVLDMHF